MMAGYAHPEIDSTLNNYKNHRVRLHVYMLGLQYASLFEPGVRSVPEAIVSYDMKTPACLGTVRRDSTLLPI